MPSNVRLVEVEEVEIFEPLVVLLPLVPHFVGDLHFVKQEPLLVAQVLWTERGAQPKEQ
jgi:hypothetical protein